MLVFSTICHTKKGDYGIRIICRTPRLAMSFVEELELNLVMDSSLITLWWPLDVGEKGKQALLLEKVKEWGRGNKGATFTC
jgi:hypothetical protein